MAVVVLLEGVGAERFTVTVSPAAELAAALHALTERAHHPAHAPWADAVLRAAAPELRAGLRRFAPLWTAVRWRGFYPGLGDLGLVRVDRRGRHVLYRLDLATVERLGTDVATALQH